MAPGDGDRPPATDDTQGPLGRVVPGEDPSERGERYLDALLNRLDPSEATAVERQANELYRQACDRGLHDGRGAEPLAAACAYVACRTIGATVSVDARNNAEEGGDPSTKPATIDEFVTEAPRAGAGTRVDDDRLRQAVDALKGEFEFGLPLRDATDYLVGLVARFDVAAPIEQRATELVDEAQAASLGTSAGRHPEALAGAALVVAHEQVGDDWPFRIDDIVQAIEPSAMTLRKRRVELRDLVESE
jgi:transcription initiation factor TFIIIB Brf1 subunit/transcription initiation factor TFIIB